MFLKKSLLFTTALALLLFAGQTSAQGPTVSLRMFQMRVAPQKVSGSRAGYGGCTVRIVP